MEQLAAYDIPEEIWSAEIDNDPFVLDELKKITDEAREDDDSYFKAATAMLHMEEVVNSEGARSFNFVAMTENIQIVSQKAAKIKIKTKVSIILKNCIYAPKIYVIY